MKRSKYEKQPPSDTCSLKSFPDEVTQCISSQLVICTPMVNSPGWTTEKTFQQPTRPADYVKILTKDLQELIQPIEWEDDKA